MMDKESVEAIRKHYSLPEAVTDKQIERCMKGTSVVAFVNFSISCNRFNNALSRALPKFIKKHLNTPTKEV
jgi:hypothetical protein